VTGLVFTVVCAVFTNVVDVSPTVRHEIVRTITTSIAELPDGTATGEHIADDELTNVLVRVQGPFGKPLWFPAALAGKARSRVPGVPPPPPAFRE
jgi:hypothetical protein